MDMACNAGGSSNKGDLMEIEFKNIEPDKDYFTPTLRLDIMWKYSHEKEAMLNAFGKLIHKGKVIGRLELDTHNIEFNIKPSDPFSNVNNEDRTNLSFTIELDAKLSNIINNSRKKDSKGDILLKAEITTVYILNEMSVTFVREYKANDWTSSADQKKHIRQSIGADADDASFLMYSYPKSKFWQQNPNLNILSARADYSYITIRHITKVLDITIKGSDWVHDFLPILGMGEYEVIEIPRINEIEELRDIMGMLNKAKQKLYVDLDIGASLTSLRNSLVKFEEFVSNNGGFDKLFKDNNNIIDLARNMQQKLHGAASRSEDSTASHTGGAKVEGYEAESMIFMAYSLYKLVNDRIKSNRVE